MNQSKFSLADVLTVLTALVFGFVCFLGANFITMGNTGQSIILSLIITLLLVTTSLGAKLLKRTKRNFKICFVWEVILLLLFTGFTFYFTITPFSHYFVVAGQKQEIQNKLTASITQAENMFANYEQYVQGRENQYKNKLDRVVLEKEKGTNSQGFIDCAFVDNFSPAIQIQEKIIRLDKELFRNYSDSAQTGLKDVASAWLSDAKSKIDGWKPIGIVVVANEVKYKSNKWRDSLALSSVYRENGEKAQNFTGTYGPSYPDVNEHFITRRNPTSLSIGLAVVAYVFMLLSWFVTKRDSRSIGALQTAPYEVVL